MLRDVARGHQTVVLVVTHDCGPALWHARKSEAMGNAAFFAERGLCCPGVETFTDAKKCPFTLQAFKRTAPYRDYVPAIVLPCLLVALVAFDVLRPLLHPELHIALGHCRVGAAMTVPETSADVDDGLGFRNHYVRPAHETLVADPEPPAGGKNPFADKNFGLCVPASYPAHYSASLLWSDSIHNWH